MTFDGFFDKYIVGGYLFLRKFFVFRLILFVIRTWYMGLPALALYILHRTLGWPLWPVWVALGLWAAVLFVRILFVRIMFRAAAENDASPQPKQENKNPYSAPKKERKKPAAGKEYNDILPK